MSYEVRIPDCEIILNAAGNDIAVICFYARDDIHQGYEVVCGIRTQNEKSAVVSLLQDAISALNTADWHSLDELHSWLDEESPGQPF